MRVVACGVHAGRFGAGRRPPPPAGRSAAACGQPWQAGADRSLAASTSARLWPLGAVQRRELRGQLPRTESTTAGGGGASAPDQLVTRSTIAIRLGGHPDRRAQALLLATTAPQCPRCRLQFNRERSDLTAPGRQSESAPTVVNPAGSSSVPTRKVARRHAAGSAVMAGIASARAEHDGGWSVLPLPGGSHRRAIRPESGSRAPRNYTRIAGYSRHSLIP